MAGSEVATNLTHPVVESRMTLISPGCRQQKNPHRRGDGDFEREGHTLGPRDLQHLANILEQGVEQLGGGVP